MFCCKMFEFFFKLYIVFNYMLYIEKKNNKKGWGWGEGGTMPVFTL